jgi:succinyl-CoA synthetase alpha subunit
MGHAGAIVSGGSGDADSKVKVMRDCGFIMSESPSGLGKAVLNAIEQWK